MLVHNAPYPDPLPFRSADSDLGKTNSVPVLRSSSNVSNELIVTNKEECKFRFPIGKFVSLRRQIDVLFKC